MGNILYTKENLLLFQNRWYPDISFYRYQRYLLEFRMWIDNSVLYYSLHPHLMNIDKTGYHK